MNSECKLKPFCLQKNLSFLIRACPSAYAAGRRTTGSAIASALFALFWRAKRIRRTGFEKPARRPPSASRKMLRIKGFGSP
ncbi:hypothetical protein HMPREF9554_01430 [Treponema phagedenis F0421]|nr:hypothetical protein HMPREF9554_01430 [Treponema phagedenis F0421]